MADRFGDVFGPQTGLFGPPSDEGFKPTYLGPAHTKIVDQLTTVSNQPGLLGLYNTVASHLTDRSLTPQDAVGTLVADVVHFAADEDLFVKTIYQTMIQDWLHALFGDNPIFEEKAAKFYAHVIMGTVAMQHLGHDHEL